MLSSERPAKDSCFLQAGPVARTLIAEPIQLSSLIGMSVDHASAVAAPKSDPVFLHVKAGMIVIATDSEWGERRE